GNDVQDTAVSSPVLGFIAIILFYKRICRDRASSLHGTAGDGSAGGCLERTLRPGYRMIGL
ncbi:MAG: hypothetical protein LBR42_01590, partial [Candidatus Methanoplasma sp.]|nr:hypothetical protein [Candidatus Methanoplasma sp.]